MIIFYCIIINNNYKACFRLKHFFNLGIFSIGSSICCLVLFYLKKWELRLFFNLGMFYIICLDYCLVFIEK